MNLVQSLGAWFLGVVTHLPIIGRYLGEANMPMMILLMLLFAAFLVYAKIKWGAKTPIAQGAGLIAKITGGVANFRAGIFGFLGSFGLGIVLLSLFATGLLGTGSELDLGKNITALPSNNYWVSYLEEGTRNEVQGWHALLHQPTEEGGRDSEHPFNVFIPHWCVGQNFTPTLGGKVSLSLFQNRYAIGPPIPEQYASPSVRKVFINN